MKKHLVVLQLVIVSIYDGRLHSDGLRSCDDVFLRLIVVVVNVLVQQGCERGI